MNFNVNFDILLNKYLVHPLVKINRSLIISRCTVQLRKLTIQLFLLGRLQVYFISTMKHKYKNIKIRLIVNFVEFDFRGMTPCPVIARMVFSHFSHVCIEVKKGFEIPLTHKNTGEYSSILGCYAVPTGKILQT